MTITLSLDPEQERIVRAAAQARGLDADTLADEIFRNAVNQVAARANPGKLVFGLHEGQGRISDDFDAPCRTAFGWVTKGEDPPRYTHVFLWLDLESAKVSPPVRLALDRPDAARYLSVVSVWEIVVKLAIGKLTMNNPLETVLEEQQRQNGLQMLPVWLDHVLALGGLPSHHKDPFDRLLIAQATVEGMTVATVDPAFSDYPVSLLW